MLIFDGRFAASQPVEVDEQIPDLVVGWQAPGLLVVGGLEDDDGLDVARAAEDPIGRQRPPAPPDLEAALVVVVEAEGDLGEEVSTVLGQEGSPRCRPAAGCPGSTWRRSRRCLHP